MKPKQKTSRMTLLHETQKKGPHWYGLFRCDCGVVKETRISHVKRGRIVSCGCFHKENHTTHGGYGTREYNAWQDMKARVLPTNPARKFYHDKGIAVCDRWQDFSNFLADMGECPDDFTLERVDNAKGYEPGNCRWASRSDNTRNRDRSRPRIRSPYRNVEPRRAKWGWRITVNYKTVRSKQSWGTPEEAARAYNEMALAKGYPLIKEVLT